MQMWKDKTPTCIEPAIEVVLKSPIASPFKYVFRSKKLEFDDDESIDANNEFTRVQLNESVGLDENGKSPLHRTSPQYSLQSQYDGRKLLQSSC